MNQTANQTANQAATIFTAGYSGCKPADLARLAESLNATVVDIRLSPNSRVPHWRKHALVGLLGARYLWLPDWGNLRFKDGPPVALKDFSSGWNTVRALPTPVLILLCACGDARVCHRRVVAEKLQAFGMDCRELDWEMAERATTDRATADDEMPRRDFADRRGQKR